MSVTEETAVRLASCGIQLEEGVLGYSRTFTVKPAVMLSDGSRVAVKFFNDMHRCNAHNVPEVRRSARRAEPTPEEIAEYAREMNIAAGLDMHHPHLLRILSFSDIPRDWLCCERLNANLYSYIRHGQSPWRPRGSLFARLLAPIASAVDFLHSKSYVHKDINSHHVLFMRDSSRVVLSGLKLSKSLVDVNIFQSSAKRGEIQWMDPECFEQPYSFESDVYSLGVILGEMLTGETPHGTDAHGLVVARQMGGHPPFTLSQEIQMRWPRMSDLFHRTTVTAKGGARRGKRPSAKDFCEQVLRAAREDDKRRSREERELDERLDAADGMHGRYVGPARDGKCVVQ